MPDLTTLALIAGLLLSAIAGQAAFFGDTLRLQINVPSSLQGKGFNEAIAEDLFSAEAARIIRGQSVIPAPTLRVRSQPGVVSALAKPLSLDSVVQALQAQMGIDNLSVAAAILDAPPKPEAKSADDKAGGRAPLEMVLIVTRPQQAPGQVRIDQEDGDPVVLVRRGAQWTMEQVAPYRVALAQFLGGVQGDPGGFTQARQTATRTLAASWTREQLSERALLYSLLGLVAAAENDLPTALTAHRSIGKLPGVAAAVRAQVVMNHAVIALALKDPSFAATLMDDLKDLSSNAEIADFDYDFGVLRGLLAWERGDLAAAEAEFRKLAEKAPLNEAGHRYLGKVLAERGDREGSAAALATALAVHRADPPQQALAVSLFWVDPMDGGLTRRF